MLNRVYIYGNSLWLPGAPAPGMPFDFLKFEIASKNSEKNWAATYESADHLWKFSTEKTYFSALCKNDKILTEIQIFGSHFLSEFCHFCTGRILCHFGAKFVTVVRSILRYVHDFFRNFLKSFSNFFMLPKKREQVSPGAKSLLPIYM